MKLRQKILLAMLLPALLSMAALYVGSSWMQARRSLHMDTGQALIRLEAYLSSQRDFLALMAAQPVFADGLSLVFYGPAEQAMESGLKTNKRFLVFSLLDQQGMVVASTQKGLEDSAFPTQWLGTKGLLQKGTDFGGLSPEGKRLMVLSAVTGPKGEHLGVLVGELDLHPILRSVGTGVKLTDRHGKVFHGVDLGGWVLTQRAQVKATGWALEDRLPVGHALYGARDQMVTLAILALVAALCTALGASSVARRLTEPLRASMTALDDLARGRLDVRPRAQGRDEAAQMAQAVTSTTAKLREVITAIGATAKEVQGQSQQLAMVSHDSSATATEVARLADDLAAGAQQLSEETETTAAKARFTADAVEVMHQDLHASVGISTEAQRVSREGTRALSQAEAAMRAIASESAEAGRQMEALQEQMAEVSGGAGVITQIADQVHLLALNAAIEAARAGEAGAGFAVVADEVRKLAAISAEAAHAMTGGIAGIGNSVKKASSAMFQAGQRINEGGRVIADGASRFTAIEKAMADVLATFERTGESVEQIRLITNELTALMDRVSAQVQQANKGNMSISAATQEITAGGEELSAMAQHLKAMADELQDTVGYFKGV